MKKLVEFLATVLFFAIIVYFFACWIDISFSVDPLFPVEMHDWNIFKHLGNA